MRIIETHDVCLCLEGSSLDGEDTAEALIMQQTPAAFKTYSCVMYERGSRTAFECWAAARHAVYSRRLSQSSQSQWQELVPSAHKGTGDGRRVVSLAET
jgi:hypothetical protein